MRRRGAAFALAGLLASSLLSGQEAPGPEPSPTRARPRARSTTPKRTLDFSGSWELDAKASQGIVPQMQDAALRVHQNGNRIWLEPLGPSVSRLLGEQIVVDGQAYEKKLGKTKGTLLAKWGNDGTSLWMEAVNGTPDDPRAAVQRMVWRLRDFGNTWTRQTWSISGERTKQTFLVFRKRPADWVPTPAPLPPTPLPTPHP